MTGQADMTYAGGILLWLSCGWARQFIVISNKRRKIGSFANSESPPRMTIERTSNELER
jgi:hypothetical protein